VDEANYQAQIVARLDTLIALFQFANADKIEEARTRVRADIVAAAILDATSVEWVNAGELKSRIAKETNQSERTVLRRIANLVAQRALEQSGTGPRVRYRSTGLL
jgi:hypothetical protein